MKPFIFRNGDEFINLTNALCWRVWESNDGSVILTVEWTRDIKDFVLINAKSIDSAVYEILACWPNN